MYHLSQFNGVNHFFLVLQFFEVHYFKFTRFVSGESIILAQKIPKKLEHSFLRLETNKSVKR